MTLKTSWTPERNERLKAFVASGASVLRVAAALKCTMTSVRNQARKLGTPFPSADLKKRLPSDQRSPG
jgi:GcrA cell cycle regulator